MHADLETFCTLVYRTSDDLLPERQRNARRKTTDAEIVITAELTLETSEPGRIDQASRAEVSGRSVVGPVKDHIQKMDHIFPTHKRGANRGNIADLTLARRTLSRRDSLQNAP